MGVPERHDVVVATENIREPTADVLEREALVGRHDLLGIARGLPEDELHGVVPKGSGEGTAGGG